VLVRLGDLDQRDVDDEAARAEERRDLGEEHRRVIGAPRVHRLARIRADEERVVAEALVEARLGVRRDAERHDVDDLGVFEVVARRESTDERLRLPGTASNEDASAVMDAPHGVGRGLDLVRVAHPPGTIDPTAHRSPILASVADPRQGRWARPAGRSDPSVAGHPAEDQRCAGSHSTPK